MGRLKPEFVSRVETFGDRVLDVVEALDRKPLSQRVLDQMMGCGTSVGANVTEADEAMSRNDFCKSLGISIKELNEARYWLRLCGRRNWIRAARLAPLIDEAEQLKRVFGSMITRTRRPVSSS